MATLMPRAGGRYLNPVEVIRRVQEAFAYVETTEQGARKQVLEWMSQLAFVAADGRAPADDNYLLSVVTISDPNGTYLSQASQLGKIRYRGFNGIG